MVEPFMHTISFQCPDCGKIGMGVRMANEEGYRLTEGFRPETRDGVPVIVCPCGAVAKPEEQTD